MTKKKEKEFDVDRFIDFVIDKWKEKDYPFDEDVARDCIMNMLYLMSNYRLKCLLRTIIDLDDLMEEYENG